jgi:endoglucanase
MDFSLLEELVETPGISGREEQVRELVQKEFTTLGARIRIDAMGSLIGHLSGKGPRIALMAHMDEVGFMVSKIESQGFVRIMPVGGIDPRVVIAQKVMIHGRKNIKGIVGSIPPHLQKKENGKEVGKAALPIEECFIDTGLPPEEIFQMVRIGDPVTFAASGWQNDYSFFAKAIDDRVGLFIMV